MPRRIYSRDQENPYDYSPTESTSTEYRDEEKTNEVNVPMAVDAGVSSSGNTDVSGSVIKVVNPSQVSTDAITNQSIKNVSVEKLTAGSITSKAITLAVSPGAGDSYIAGGNNLDLANWRGGDANGGAVILGLDDSDGDKGKFFAGNYSLGQYAQFDGATFSVAGTFSADSVLYAPLVKTYSAGEALTAGDAVYLISTFTADLERGSSQYLSIADASQTGLDLTGDFTFEMNLTIETAPSSGQAYGLIVKRNTADQFSYRCYYWNSGGTYKIRLTISANGSTETDKDWDVDLGTATNKHIAIAYDASAGSAELYINSVSQGTVTDLPTSVYNGTAPFAFGNTVSDAGVSNYFDGLLADLRVWSDIRTAQEIADNYQSELVGNETNLVGYWQLKRNFDDLTSNNNDLTNNNTIVFSETMAFTNQSALTQAFKTSASAVSIRNNFVGFIKDTVSANATCTVVIQGEKTGFTGLTTGRPYYLSDTAGLISISAGTVTRKVGIATSPTSLLITNIW